MADKSVPMGGYTCIATATTANEGREADKILGGEEDKGNPICEPEGPGQILRDAIRLQVYKGFHDGGRGLCSPGRWKRDAGKLTDGAGWYWLRRELKKKFLEFVLGGQGLGRPYAWSSALQG